MYDLQRVPLHRSCMSVTNLLKRFMSQSSVNQKQDLSVQQKLINHFSLALLIQTFIKDLLSTLGTFRVCLFNRYSFQCVYVCACLLAYVCACVCVCGSACVYVCVCFSARRKQLVMKTVHSTVLVLTVDISISQSKWPDSHRHSRNENNN